MKARTRKWIATESDEVVDLNILDHELETTLTKSNDKSIELDQIVEDGIDYSDACDNLRQLKSDVEDIPEEQIKPVLGVIKVAAESYTSRWCGNPSIEIGAESNLTKDAVLTTINVSQESMVETGKKWIKELLRRFLEFMKSLKALGAELTSRAKSLRAAMKAKFAKDKSFKIEITDPEKFSLHRLTLGDSGEFDINALANFLRTAPNVYKLLSPLDAFDEDTPEVAWKWLKYESEISLMGRKLTIVDRRINRDVVNEVSLIKTPTIDAKTLEIYVKACEQVAVMVKNLENDRIVSNIERDLNALNDRHKPVSKDSHLHSLYAVKAGLVNDYLTSLKQAYTSLDLIIRWAVSQGGNPDSINTEEGSSSVKK